VAPFAGHWGSTNKGGGAQACKGVGWSFTLDERRGGERAMAYASAEGGGGYGVDASIIHFDPAHADHIKVPDAELLFRGEYQR
jgi:hypothetical protein